MAIISCPSCGNSISSEALVCPKCNNQVSRQTAPAFTQQAYTNSPEHKVSSSVPTVGDWIINFLLLSIPLVNLIILIVWAVDNENPVRKNFAAAALLWAVILFFFFIVFWGSIIAALM